jgi:hypothetical protein
MTISVRNLPPVGGALLILFFFLPWVSASCSMAPDVRIDVSGYEMASGYLGGSYGGQTDATPLMWLFPLLAIGSVGALSKGRSGLRLSLISGLLGLFGLLVFAITVMSYGKDAAQGGFDIRFQYGYWLSWLAFGLHAGSSYWLTKEEQGESIKIPGFQMPVSVEIERAPPVTPDVRPHPPPRGEALAWLRFIEGPIAGTEVPITSEDFLIGRGSFCDLQLKDPSVSREHARLRYAQGVWFIQDQGSARGMYINGNLVEAARLHSEDQVQLSNSKFVFILIDGFIN